MENCVRQHAWLPDEADGPSDVDSAVYTTTQSGFALLEALVAMLVFALGILGLVGMQATMARETTNAKLRSDAAYLAQELIGSMWGDVANLANYKTTSCNGYTRCSDWLKKVNYGMPKGSATIDVDPATGNVTVIVYWTMSKDDAAGTKEEHQYTLNTTIVAAGAT